VVDRARFGQLATWHAVIALAQINAVIYADADGDTWLAELKAPVPSELLSQVR
jgi:hypothetical protein